MKKRKYSKIGQKKRWPPIVESKKKNIQPVGYLDKASSKVIIKRLDMKRFYNSVGKSGLISLDLIKQYRSLAQNKRDIKKYESS